MTRPGSHRSRSLPFFVLVLVIGMILVTAFWIESWHGRHDLTSWKSQMTAQGEVFELNQLYPPSSGEFLDFSNRFAQARNQLPNGFLPYCGTMNGFAKGPDGKVLRGSQAAYPLAYSTTNSWMDLDAAARQATPALQTIRTLMQNPSPVLEEYFKKSEDGTIPNYANIRVNAQALSTAALNDLHKGNLERAMDNLIALSAFTGLNEKDPSLVNYMIRVAILNLGVSVYWDALQATGWTDDQLAELQRACQAVALLSQMSKVPEAERVGRLHQLEQFRSGTYEQWITRHQAVIASLGQRRLARDMGPLVRFWRQWGFHPLWRLAWACPEELLYLQHMQTEIEAIRAATRQGQWSQLKHRLEEIHQPYQLPATRWRFYYRLPILDDLSEIIGPAPGPTNRCPFVDFTKAWSTTYKTLTLNNLVITAIALKRHFLRYGKYPDTLNDLCPEYLSAVPLDLMDGQPLRYHLNSGGAYVLYSIGDDLKDDHGTARLDLESDSSWINPWLGPDWVWPQ